MFENAFCEIAAILFQPQCVVSHWGWWVNTLRPRQHGHHFTDDTFKHIFLNENVGISIEISLKFVHKGPINNMLALVQIMNWRRVGDKPLSESMVCSLLTHICVTRPQWVKEHNNYHTYCSFNSFLFRITNVVVCQCNIDWNAMTEWHVLTNFIQIAEHIKGYLILLNIQVLCQIKNNFACIQLKLQIILGAQYLEEKIFA